jgi:RNA polymerase sigma factor (sigma-70 family)
MPDSSFDSIQMQQCIERWQTDDRAAADELLRAAGRRLEDLTRRLFRGFPRVQDWVETADVFQGSVLRLVNALREVRPASTRDFFNLAAVQTRRELIDLARRFRGERFARLAPTGAANDSSVDSPLNAVSAPAPEGEELERWAAFHEAVERLPVEEREVISLVFYHGWIQAEVAQLLQCSERTVQRRWASGCLALHQALGGRLPPE